MNRSIAAFACTWLAAALLAYPASAHEPDASGCPVHVDATSATSPNIADPPTDWNGLLGNGIVSPWGDVYREGTDIREAWMSRTPDGAFHAHIRVSDLTDVQPGSLFYLLWTFRGAGDQTTERRWVSAINGTPAGPGVSVPERHTFAYGYVGPSETAPGSLHYTTQGTTTGIIDPDTDTVTIDVPMAEMGSPRPGAVLRDVASATKILFGSPTPLPEQSPVRYGYVFDVDDTTNATRRCDVLVNDPKDT